MATHQRTRAKSCSMCSVGFVGHGNSKYCSSRCANRYRDMRRMNPCSICAAPMWASRDRAATPICQPCRRAQPSYKNRNLPPTETWTCIDCGSRSERATVRGAKPKRCTPCRKLAEGPRIESRAAIRTKIYTRDGWQCWLCERPVDGSLAGSDSLWRPSLDHVTPVSQGGTDAEDNLRLAHMWCNAVRGDGHMYSPDHFRTSIVPA